MLNSFFFFLRMKLCFELKYVYSLISSEQRQKTVLGIKTFVSIMLFCFQEPKKCLILMTQDFCSAAICMVK